MATQWAPHHTLSIQREKSEFLSIKKCYNLFALVVHSVGVSQYGHYKAEAKDSLLYSGPTIKAFFTLGKQRTGSKYVAMITA